MGVYANDLAYSPDINEDIYLQTHNNKNILQIVWILDLIPCSASVNTSVNNNATISEDVMGHWTLKPVKPVIVARQSGCHAY